MSLTVIGSLAFDSIETPFDKRDEAFGGSATFFAAAAARFGKVGMVGVVGTDLPDKNLGDLRDLGVDCSGIEVADGKTFRWGGRYGPDWNTRTTLFTELNTFEHFDPKVPAEYKDSEFVFLANAAPTVQMKALEQFTAPKFVVADTMNLWIDIMRDDLVALLKKIDGLVLNDEEACMLTGETHLLAAARKVLEMGPKYVVLKKGEHGAFLIGKDVHFSIPAYPVDKVVDPTGAGDSFAGGFMGHIAAEGNYEPATMRKAMVYGTVTASFCVQGFTIEPLAANDRASIENRYNEMVGFITL
ncbi:MAG: sugar/nucleoside kinase (ribokinase family) [Planctomycetota bacterium]|jgi:sugar/nucleoside kinase (ribokinase family)